MKNSKKQPTLSFFRIIALTTLFSALSLLPYTSQESNSTFSQAFGPRQLFAQEADKNQHHDHSNCSHGVAPKTDKEQSPVESHQHDKDHQPEEVRDHVEESHENHEHQDNDHEASDHQEKLKQDDHSDCGHDHSNNNQDQGRLSHPTKSENHSESAEEADNNNDHKNCDHSANDDQIKLEQDKLNQGKVNQDDHSDCNHDHSSHNHAPSNPQAAESCSESTVEMSTEEIKRFGIVVEKVKRNRLEVLAKARGEISLNRDRMAHIVPRVSGIVQEVRSTLGDFVEKGEIMAILESRELADAKTEYLTATKHLKLAKSVFKREEKLWRKKVSSEQDYLTAERDYAETRITLQSCEQRLRILGFSEAGLKKLSSEPIAELTRFAVRSPFSGRVIKKNIVLGEIISDAVEIFVVADLKTVWVDLDLFRNDADNIRKGQKVMITVSSQTQPIVAVIDYVAPLVDEKTRTTLARIVLDNQNEELRPGSFITAEIVTKKIRSGVVVARDILQNVGGQTCVFIQDDHGFEPRPVTLGRTNEKEVVITSGLHPGEMVVAKNGFRLKAALETGVGSGCSSPGHAH